GKVNEIKRLKERTERELEKREEKEEKYLENPRYYRKSLSTTWKWIKILKKRLEAIENPDEVVKELENEMNKKMQRYKECREYALHPDKVKKDIKKNIETNEKSLNDLEKKIQELEKILKK
ncbi:MAG: hypothetical protein DRO40_11850, partial [Thermoprotei archaeon]